MKDMPKPVITEDELKKLSFKKPLPYLWKHSWLAYYEPDNADSSILLKGCEYTSLKNETDYAYVAVYQDYVVICFQGTKGTVKAWAMDFDPYPLKADEYAGKFLKGKDGKGTIHDGFYTAWSYFKPAIKDLIKAFDLDKKIKPIFVTGHSRGGALAELCARDLAKNLGIPCSCITFGSPAPGTKEYRNEFRLLPINGTRVQNGWDLVCYLPPDEFGFRHGCAGFEQLPAPWWQKFIPSIRIRHHIQENYDKQIMKRMV